jgi:hypothetical protein
MMYFESSSCAGFNSSITYLNLGSIPERFFADKLPEKKKKTWVAYSILAFHRPLVCDVWHHKVPMSIKMYNMPLMNLVVSGTRQVDNSMLSCIRVETRSKGTQYDIAKGMCNHCIIPVKLCR